MLSFCSNLYGNLTLVSLVLFISEEAFLFLHKQPSKFPALLGSKFSSIQQGKLHNLDGADTSNLQSKVRA